MTHPGLSRTRRQPLFRRAFTVVELMVAISIMTLIVLVLYGIFDQVQKALRGNVAQVDVLEGGRAASELMTRELEQMQAASVFTNANFYAGLTAPLLGQEMLETNIFRTNVLQEVYFLSHFNKSWTATAYRVLSFTNRFGLFDHLATTGVGTLARYSITIHESELGRTNLFARLMGTSPAVLNNYQRVTDGVVHFRLRAFDRRGFILDFDTLKKYYPTNSEDFTEAGLPAKRVWLGAQQPEPANVFVRANLGEFEWRYESNAVPAYLELELGILEPQVLARFIAFPNRQVATNYLAKQTGKVHLFHQRIPVRTAQ